MPFLSTAMIDFADPKLKCCLIYISYKKRKKTRKSNTATCQPFMDLEV